MFKTTLLAASAVAIVGLFGATPASAQWPDYRFDWGINGGYSYYTGALDNDRAGTIDQNVKFKAGWLAGSQLTWWAMPWLGIRANGTYTDRPLRIVSLPDNPTAYGDVNLWNASGDVMLRYSAPRIGKPYLALGAGAMIQNPAGKNTLFPASPTGDTVQGFRFSIPGNDSVAVVNGTSFMGLVALGTDVRLAKAFAFRFEVGDRIARVPLRAGPNWLLKPGNVQHNLYGQLGAHVLFGYIAPPVVAVAPAPPPAPKPAPPPPPREEHLSVCVIDPNAANGLEVVSAIYLPASRDTLVEVAGQRRPLSSTLPTNVMMATQADWFVRGEPLTLMIAPKVNLEYTTWQSARIIDPSDITYLGLARGLPVYAANQDVMTVSNQLPMLRQQTNSDLSTMLQKSRDLRQVIEKVQYLYVPLQPTGCVFQTVRQVEQVRKKW